MDIKTFTQLTTNFETLNTQLKTEFDIISQYDFQPNRIKKMYYNYQKNKTREKFQQISDIYYQLVNAKPLLLIVMSEVEVKLVITHYNQIFTNLTQLNQQYLNSSAIEDEIDLR